MLQPALLHKEEINKRFVGVWYDPNYMWYSMDAGLSIYDPADNSRDHHQFVSIDKDNNILGVISYSVNWETKSATNLGIMAFERFNLVFGKDLMQAIHNIFFKYNLNRLTFYSVADNPVVKSYRRFINQYGGTISGYEHQCCMLLDGKLHDMECYEIMAENFKPAYLAKHKKGQNHD